MNLPKIVVGGFSHTGTSLVVQILHEMKFSVGNAKKMNRHDAKKRPFGYWTYVPLRNVVHSYVEQKLGGGFGNACEPGYMPKNHLPFNARVAKKIQEVAARDGVEVFKELSLPLTWSLFPKDAKFIFMSRSEKVLYQHWAYKVKGWDQFFAAWNRYQKMGREMGRRVDTLHVQYEDFAKRFPEVIEEIAGHVGVDMSLVDVDTLLRIYTKDVKIIDV